MRKMNHGMTRALICCFAALFMVPSLALAGTLQFYANGEELATEGFLAPKLTKDGWSVTFSNVIVNVAEVAAYQTSPGYDAHKGGPIVATATAALDGAHILDLAADATHEGRVLVGEVQAPAGHYNAISWKVLRASSGPWAGKSMVFVGTAEKDGKKVDFQITSDEETTYKCGEFVGDERKGFLEKGGTADLEMTFHLDHIFGRADKPAGDHMNVGAAGFAPFADGKPHAIKLKGMHIGHAGEGHCSVEWH